MPCEYVPITALTACDDGLCSTADSYNALTCACEHTPITPPNCDDNDCGTADVYNTSTCPANTPQLHRLAMITIAAPPMVTMP
ncbi:MAG: hypothetical protein IPN94_13270 [Sphingobacteriales bacterium]|nr:hypothetical protein [Sphingobacteriales bacterium]